MGRSNQPVQHLDRRAIDCRGMARNTLSSRDRAPMGRPAPLRATPIPSKLLGQGQEDTTRQYRSTDKEGAARLLARRLSRATLGQTTVVENIEDT